MSVAMIAARTLLHANPKKTLTLETLRAKVEADRTEAPPTAAVLKIADVATRTINGWPVLHLTPHRRATGRQVIYLHGGGYTGPILKSHWAIIATLLGQTGASFTVPLYGLAPEHGADEAYDLIDEVCARVALNSKKVFLAGDSAGATLALGEAIRRRDAALSPPTGVILFSPWVDATLSNRAIEPLVRKDPMLGPVGLAEAARWWAGERGVRDPLISPLTDSLVGLPPLRVYQGGYDIFAPDTALFVARAAAAGADVKLRFEPQAFHVYVGAPSIPEAKSALADVARFVTET